MQKVLPYCLIVLMLILTSFIPVDEVVKAIKKGNATELSRHFDNTIEITLANKKNIYSKKQAELVLKDFFLSSMVKGFNIVHKGNNINSQFIIGILSTKKGEYRTTIFMKKKEKKHLLQELRFEK